MNENEWKWRKMKDEWRKMNENEGWMNVHEGRKDHERSWTFMSLPKKQSWMTEVVFKQLQILYSTNEIQVNFLVSVFYFYRHFTNSVFPIFYFYSGFPFPSIFHF